MGALRSAVDWYEQKYEDLSGYASEFIEAHPVWAAIVIFAVIVTFFETYERYIQRKNVRRYLTTCLKELGNSKSELKGGDKFSETLKQVLTSISNCEREEMRGYEYWTRHFELERRNLDKILGEIVNIAESKLKSNGGPKLKIQDMLHESDEPDERLIKRYQQVLKIYINSYKDEKDWLPFVVKDFLPVCRKNEQVRDVVGERMVEISKKYSVEENDKLAEFIVEQMAYFDEDTGQVLQFENYKEVTYALTSLNPQVYLFRQMIKLAFFSNEKEYAEDDLQHIAIRLIEVFPDRIQTELIEKDNQPLIEYFNKIDPTFYKQLMEDHRALQNQGGNSTAAVTDSSKDGGAQGEGEDSKVESGGKKKGKKNKKSKKE